jgi:hypothetical protein
MKISKVYAQTKTGVRIKLVIRNGKASAEIIKHYGTGCDSSPDEEILSHLFASIGASTDDSGKTPDAFRSTPTVPQLAPQEEEEETYSPKKESEDIRKTIGYGT